MWRRSRWVTVAAAGGAVSKPVAKAKKHCQALIDRCQLFGLNITVDAQDAPFVDRSEVIDERERFFCQAAGAGLEGRIEQAFSWGASDRYDTNQRKTLIARDVGITYQDARSHATLFVADGGAQSYDDHSAPPNSHA